LISPGPDKGRLIYRLTEDFEHFHEGKVEAEVKAENTSSNQRL
jgi:hypothetical protein